MKKKRKKHNTPVNPGDFADVLTGIGGHGGWIGAALGSGRLKRRRGRKPTKTELFKEAEKLRDQNVSWPNIAKKLTPDAYKENPRNAGEAMRQGVIRQRKQKPSD